MDTSGNFYGSPEAQEEIGKILGKLGAEKMRPIEEMPAGSISIESEAVAKALAGMNRRQRRAFVAERRRGASEETAIGRAELVL